MNVAPDFPPLAPARGKRLPVYLDNACMTFKPRAVLEAMNSYYEQHPSCHNRAQHALGRETTARIHEARRAIGAYLGAARPEEVVFTRNTTEAINLVARGLRLRAGDIVLTTDLEHNSNLLPWQFLARREGIRHQTLGIRPDEGTIDLEAYEAALRSGPVRLVSVFHSSHVTGITLPVAEMARLAHRHGARILVDGAQALSHHPVDVRAWDADFLAVSFHKAYGPTGMGALYGKTEALSALEPVWVGGETVLDADYDSCVLAEIPARFEAGLQDYAGILGAAAAVRYLRELDPKRVERHVVELNSALADAIRGNPRIRILGTADPRGRGAICNLLIDGLAAEELAVLLDRSHGIMVRSGVHCCHAWYRKNGLPPSLRISFAAYNSREDVALVARALEDLTRYF